MLPSSQSQRIFEKLSFDGTEEKRPPPKKYSDTEIVNQVQDLEGQQLSRDLKKGKKISHKVQKYSQNKKSVFS